MRPAKIAILTSLLFPFIAAAEIPPELRPWLQQPQTWQRDTDGPVLSLGEAGAFDDTHIFAPAVIWEENAGFRLFYCGSRGEVANRVFHMGLATGDDGRAFAKHPGNPVLAFADGRRSVLTQAFLRSGDGSVLREDGKLRMWFSATDFQDESGLHTLHETFSEDGIAWSQPSGPLLENVYAPTILRDAEGYRMWYADVSANPWIIRHARSGDGRNWQVTPEPCIVIDQAWEKSRLFYPTVRKIGEAYLMWYGSYWAGRPQTTATGFAVSLDGYTWHKHAANPVHKPDPDRPWESHYVTNQSILRLPDGSFRIWYAGRRKPPFANKYFSISTAVWKPKPVAEKRGELDGEGATIGRPFSVAAVLVDENALDLPHDVELLGDLAIVPGKGGSLAIVDVANPNTPKIIWSRHDENELDEAETVLVGQNRVFLGTHDFHSIDVSNPREPRFQGKIADRARITRINGMARRGNTILAACKDGWLTAFDVGDPANPSLAGAVNLAEKFGVASPHDVDWFREFAVIADPNGFGRENKPGAIALIRVFDSQGRLLPEADWRLAGNHASADLGGANRVQISGRHAFAGVSTRARGGRLIVVDLADPAAPRKVAEVPFAPGDGWGPNGLTIAGNVVFLAGGQSVEAIDISDPARPVKLAGQRFPKELRNAHPRYPGGGDSGHDLVYRDGFLYVTGQSDCCLLILRVASERIRQLAAAH